eukprot:6480736-Amphidinium_carterae.3
MAMPKCRPQVQTCEGHPPRIFKLASTNFKVSSFKCSFPNPVAEKGPVISVPSGRNLPVTNPWIQNNREGSIPHPVAEMPD